MLLNLEIQVSVSAGLNARRFQVQYKDHGLGKCQGDSLDPHTRFLRREWLEDPDATKKIWLFVLVLVLARKHAHWFLDFTNADRKSQVQSNDTLTKRTRPCVSTTGISGSALYRTHGHTHTHTGKTTKGKVQDIGEVNKVMPLPLPSSDRVRGYPFYVSRGHSKGNLQKVGRTLNLEPGTLPN